MPFLVKYKELLIELVKREIKSRYKQSVLGYFWVLLVPLINLVVMTVVFSFFIKVPTGDTPYVIFLFAGLIPWMFTLNSITVATTSVVQNSSLITKIFIPRRIFPLASVLTKTIDLILNLLVMFCLIFFYNETVGWMILFLPLIYGIHFLLILGVSYILSSINVYFRDVENVLGVFLTMWMYLTPIFYPSQIVPENYKFLFGLNPLTPIIDAYRDIIIYNKYPFDLHFLYSAIFAILIFILGNHVFKKLSRGFADVI